jgi:hypothetical protein
MKITIELPDELYRRAEALRTSVAISAIVDAVAS